MDLIVEVHGVKRHAIVDVAVSSSCQCRHWCSHCRAFRSACCCTLCRPNSHTVVVHPTLFPVAIFHKCFHSILTAFLGVVFTLSVGYSRPTSAVNDPTVIKASEFGKIMP